MVGLTDGPTCENAGLCYQDAGFSLASSTTTGSTTETECLGALGTCAADSSSHGSAVSGITTKAVCDGFCKANDDTLVTISGVDSANCDGYCTISSGSALAVADVQTALTCAAHCIVSSAFNAAATEGDCTTATGTWTAAAWVSNSAWTTNYDFAPAEFFKPDNTWAAGTANIAVQVDPTKLCVAPTTSDIALLDSDFGMTTGSPGTYVACTDAWVTD